MFVGSTIIEQGIQGLMEDICTYFPHPRHHGRFRLANGEETFVDERASPPHSCSRRCPILSWGA